MTNPTPLNGGNFMKQQKAESKIFRVNKSTGISFIAAAELIGMNENDLLEEMMSQYVDSMKSSIADIANKYPQFAAKYPFIQ